MEPYAGILVMCSFRVPRHAQVPQEYVQRTEATTVAASTTSVYTGEHDGTNDDVEPNEPTSAVHEPADDGRTGTDANNAVTADDGTVTAYDGADGANATHGAAATVRLTEYAAVGPSNAALCWIWHGITHEEDLLVVRGGRTDIFEQ